MLVERQDLRGWLWVHIVVNAGLHAQALKAGSVGRLMNSLALSRDAIPNLRELLPILVARGVRLKEFKKDIVLFQLPTWVGTAAMKGAYRL